MCVEFSKIRVGGMKPLPKHPSFLCGGMVAKERSLVG